VAFEPTNGGFAGQASGTGLFPFSRLGMSSLLLFGMFGHIRERLCNGLCKHKRDGAPSAALLLSCIKRWPEILGSECESASTIASL
jgi:hypothetical protein